MISLSPLRFLPSNGQTGSYSGPEVGFAEIAVDLLQARFSVLSERQLIADVRAVEINAISLNGIEDDIPLAIGLLRLCFTVAKLSRKYFARGRGDYGSFVCLEFVSE